MLLQPMANCCARYACGSRNFVDAFMSFYELLQGFPLHDASIDEFEYARNVTEVGEASNEI
jgi:hypothetical protein